MRAGKLRHKIALLRQIKTSDAIGGISVVWEPYAENVRCYDVVKSTNQKMNAQIELQEEIHTIQIRYRNDIRSDDRVLLTDGRMLSISGIPTPDEKRTMLTITAQYEGA